MFSTVQSWDDTKDPRPGLYDHHDDEVTNVNILKSVCWCIVLRLSLALCDLLKEPTRLWGYFCAVIESDPTTSY